MKSPRLVEFTDGSAWWVSQGKVDRDEKCSYCGGFTNESVVVLLDQVRRGFLDHCWLGTRVAHAVCFNES